MNLDKTQLKEILIEQHYVSEEDMQKAEAYAEKNNSQVIDYLFQEKVLNKNLLGQAIAEHYQFEYSDLKANEPAVEQVRKIPAEIAQKYNIILFKETPTQVVITTDDPFKKDQFLPEIESLFFNKEVLVTFSFKEDIEDLFIGYKKSLETRFSQILKKQNKVASEIIEEILNDAVSYKASDIHLEPQEDEVLIRFRIDGVLEEAGRIEKDLYESILNRVKVKAQIRIDEHQTTQDGAIRMVVDGNPTDIRVSIIPVLDGEKMVLRILSEYIRTLAFDDLGLNSTDQRLIQEAAHRQTGMILVTGPTGSGKTTTLYSVLRSIHKPEINITTIEDPVEYKIPGINQIQVNPQKNITFAKGLRSIIRQDPNVILVGEIRDEETAEIAINASLTGHLLLSTFHANNAATAIPRLKDMGVEDFLLASTLNLIIAQRLVRKICQTCRTSTVMSINDLKKSLPEAEKYFQQDEITLYQSKGCSACNKTGYKGRIGIFELIYMTDELQNLILQNPSMGQIWSLAKQQGAHSFFDDGIEKVKSGITSLSEVMRIAPPPTNSEKLYGKA